MSIFLRREEESEVRWLEKEGGMEGITKKSEVHLTASSSQGIMGITWAQNASAVPVMRAAGRKEGCGRLGPGNLA